jgi:hypothetical protein
MIKVFELFINIDHPGIKFFIKAEEKNEILKLNSRRLNSGLT